MKIFLAITAIVSWLFGIMLLFFAKDFYTPMGIEVTDQFNLIAQAEGAGLIGLGVFNWMARNMDRYGQISILAGNLLTQAISLVLLTRASMLHIVSGTASGIATHLIFGAGFAWFLLRATRTPSGT
ncbi:MAG TPA: hypothetical protein VHL14_12610 [Steroidobacteraceae bacterium]|jgi:hypothetical protein|nr:hypothetical protein [Steroidobacteraceae bacterium]